MNQAKKVLKTIKNVVNEGLDSSLPFVVLLWTADGDKRVVGTFSSEAEAKKQADAWSKQHSKWDVGEFTVTKNTPELAKTI